jgi:hypothetical protein
MVEEAPQEPSILLTAEDSARPLNGSWDDKSFLFCENSLNLHLDN